MKSGQRIIVRRCPDELHDAFRGLGAAFDRGTIAEVTVSFVRRQSDVDNACKEAVALTAPHGVLWMAYPKEGAAIAWDAFKNAGWHPASEISLDETWSAMRFRPAADTKA